MRDMVLDFTEIQKEIKVLGNGSMVICKERLSGYIKMGQEEKGSLKIIS
jgi:hypothetical protein